MEKLEIYRLNNSTLEEARPIEVTIYIPGNFIKYLLEIYEKNFNISDSN